MTDIDRAMFDESKVKRGTGAQGGQFSSKGGAQKATRPQRAGRAKPGGARATAAGTLSFDGKRGTGYGQAGGDKRVKALQGALNKLGLTDSAGNKLKLDGKLGPKTTAAVKKAQRALGIPADGKVTPALLRRLTSGKKLGKAKPAKAAPVKKAAPAKKTPARKTAPARKVAPRAAAPRKTTAAGPPRRAARTVNVSTS